MSLISLIFENLVLGLLYVGLSRFESDCYWMLKEPVPASRVLFVNKHPQMQARTRT